MTRAVFPPTLPPLLAGEAYALTVGSEAVQGIRLIRVLCPACGAVHSHAQGLPAEGQADGHPGRRRARCFPHLGRMPEYVVVVPENLWAEYTP